MNKKRLMYFVITLIFIILSIIVLSKFKISNNVELSKAIQIILILYLIRLSYGCTLYIRKQYKKNKYSYSIIMNLGLIIFININILRQINLFISNFNILSINDIYNNTLKSFSFFAMITLPCIILLSIYSIITNFVLIKKENFSYKNLLGIFLGVLSIIGLFGSQGIYILTTKLITNENGLLIKKIIDISINGILSYLYTLIIATLYCNIKAAKHKPKYDKDFIIILGSQIRSDGSLTPLLKARVDKAIDFGLNQYKNTNKEIMYIPSGGKGSDEVIPEAKAIENYLISKGINKNSIIIEDKSTNTFENMRYSKNKINKINTNGKIIFSTTNYHVFRSGMIAYECGIDCEGIGSKTKWYFYTNALIREFIANLVQEKKRHIALLFLIILSSIILVVIGYIYKLF